VKSLKDRLHQCFNVSAAETDYQDVATRRASAACEHRSTACEQVLREADRLVDGAAGAHRGLEHELSLICAHRATGLSEVGAGPQRQAEFLTGNVRDPRIGS
jgi:uncharacterized protein YlxP (DUF503 family)